MKNVIEEVMLRGFTLKQAENIVKLNEKRLLQEASMSNNRRNKSFPASKPGELILTVCSTDENNIIQPKSSPSVEETQSGEFRHAIITKGPINSNSVSHGHINDAVTESTHHLSLDTHQHQQKPHSLSSSSNDDAANLRKMALLKANPSCLKFRSWSESDSSSFKKSSEVEGNSYSSPPSTGSRLAVPFEQRPPGNFTAVGAHRLLAQRKQKQITAELLSAKVPSQVLEILTPCDSPVSPKEEPTTPISPTKPLKMSKRNPFAGQHDSPSLGSRSSVVSPIVTVGRVGRVSVHA